VVSKNKRSAGGIRPCTRGMGYGKASIQLISLELGILCGSVRATSDVIQPLSVLSEGGEYKGSQMLVVRRGHWRGLEDDHPYKESVGQWTENR